MKNLMRRSSLKAMPAAGPQGTPLEPGTMVWVRDSVQVWTKAEVQSIDGSNVQVRTDDGDDITLTSAEKIYRCNPETWKTEGLTGVHDLSKLTHLHEPEVLHALHLRFDVDHIYTFCGPILIAVNPFKDLGSLYANVHDKKFKDLSKPPPHIYTVASRAFQGLSGARQSQVVLISGESGAGKTETTKHVLKFLTSQLGGAKRRPSAVGKSESLHSGTEKKVLSSNPILEAFGNACTVRNNNSSRFGKFIELRFQLASGAATFSNAGIETYLLEKVRVTKIDKQERSYHIFYQACAAHANLDPSDVEGLPLEHFPSPEEFKYLKQSDRFDLDGVDDAEEFQATRRSMEAMEISLQEQAEILRVVAAVLHIGNIPLVGEEGGGGKVKVQASNKSFQAVCDIMGIQPEVLTRAMTHKHIMVSGESYDSPLTLDQCEARRESFARMIYSYLFNHVVFRINESFAAKRGGAKPSSFIGVLDIFGFEHFQVNSFEQLCINFANERLQQMFNHFVFEVEMELYKQEGITCDFSDFPDNQGIIDLIQAKSMSIFTLLDEECRMPKGSDKALVQKLWKQFDKHENFKIEPRKNMCFTVVHFAGPVSYDVTNFMDKNMDELGELLKNAMKGSKNEFVRSLIERADETAAAGKSPSQQSRAVAGRGGKTLKPHTVAADFKGQLEQLVTKMRSASPHFVRCIKPNPEKLPDRLERELVVEQLRSGGVIEALHVQRAGFPCRSPLKSCWKDFLSLIFKSDERARFGAMSLDACLRESLQQLAKELKWPASQPLYAIGKTTVFFKQVAYETIEGMRMAMLGSSAKKIQSAWRIYLMRSLFQMIRERAILVQSHTRRWLVRNKVWNDMKPSQRRRSALFRAYLAANPSAAKSSGETDSEEEREAEAERQRLEKLRVSREEQEQQRREEERLQKEMEEKKRQEEEAERQRLEEERLRLEQEAAQRRKEEEESRLEQARQKGAEEERRRAEEARQQLEASFQEERTAAQLQHNEELRQLRSRVASVQDAQEAAKVQQDAEVLKLKEEVENRKAQVTQQESQIKTLEEELQERIKQLEEDNGRLKAQMQEESQNHAAQMQELEEQHRASLDSSAEQLETQRVAYVRQMEEMRQGLDQEYRQEQDALKAMEQEQNRRFQEELQQLRDRDAQQRQRHEEELQQLREREEERQRKTRTEMGEALRDSSLAGMEKRLLEEQVTESKAEVEQTQLMMERQSEELKRVHQLQVEMLEQRAAEKERALQQEVDLLRKQKDSQVTSLRAQMEFQTAELRQTAEQEVALMKQEFERRERSLQQMLDQARLGQEEEQRTSEMQLALKLKRQEDQAEAQEAKIRALEESGKRQQELYERHVGQLTEQMRNSQDNFRKQLEAVQAENDESLQAAKGKFAEVERSLKSERERVVAEVQQEREEHASKLAQAEELSNRVGGMQKETEELRKQLLEARMKLLDRPFRREEAAAAAFAPQARRSSEPDVKADLAAGRRKSVRQLLLPLKLAEPQATSKGPKEKREEKPPARPRGSILKRRTTIAVTEKSEKVKLDLQALNHRFLIGADALVAQGAKAEQGELLEPSLKGPNGEPQNGAVSVWAEIECAGLQSVVGKKSDGAVTALCFRETYSESHELLAVGCKSGALSIFRVRRTAMERKAEEELREEDVEVVDKLFAHTKAITSMCFSAGGDRIVTTSSDLNVHVYSIKDKAIVEKFTDSSLVVCAVSVPKPVGALITANATNVLRLRGFNTQQDKVHLDHYARSLLVCLGGQRLLAGTSKGYIHFFDINDEGVRLSTEGIQVRSNMALTCLTLAPCSGQPPLVAANCMDNMVIILQANANVTNLTVQHRFSNAHRILPLRSCHVPGFGAGSLASGAEDGLVRVFDLESFSESSLKAHTVPVVDIAVSRSRALLASGDVHGRVVLWRRGAQGMANGVH